MQVCFVRKEKEQDPDPVLFSLIGYLLLTLTRLKPWDSCFFDLCHSSFKELVLHGLHRRNFPHALR